MKYRTIHPWFSKTFAEFHDIPIDLRTALWNYFAYAMHPGSFVYFVLVNNFYGVAQSAHPALSVACFRDLAEWLLCHAPTGSYGSIDMYNNWQAKTNEERCDTMIAYRLRPNEFDILSGAADA